jgi:beta-lactamase regulating signal transducer with metallopeptidase domain
MTEALINHLWQSTLFALAAAALTLAFRKNGAHIRFYIWLAASVKFLIPFPFFVLIGSQLRWETAPTVVATRELSQFMNQITQPGTLLVTNNTMPSVTTASTHWSVWSFIVALWSIGVTVLLFRRVSQWTRLHNIVKTSSPLNIESPITVRETKTALEPGIFGIFSPTLLLPEGIAARLAPEQLDTIVAHELCHWRRKDNLTAAIHMIVEVLFWFHPIVWWLGNRLIIERERACDENVVQAGSDRQVYAEGILKVCKLYVEPPLLCIAGVSGGTLRKRIEEIMTNQIQTRLHFAKKSLLSIASSVAIVGPIALGIVSGTHNIAMAQETPANQSDMKHYKSSEWKFELDVPKRWNTFPAVPTNSPFEVIRFMSKEDGTHNLIIFRNPHNPQQSAKAAVDQVQQILAKGGFSNFVTSETSIGSRRVLALDFDRPTPDGGTWSCREYFVINGTLMYVLGFGTTKRDAMFDLFDRMAKTFVSDESAG